MNHISHISMREEIFPNFLFQEKEAVLFSAKLLRDKTISDWPLTNFNRNEFCGLKILVSHTHLWQSHAKVFVTAHSCNDSVSCCLPPYLSFSLGRSLSRLLSVSFAGTHQLKMSSQLVNVMEVKRTLRADPTNLEM